MSEVGPADGTGVVVVEKIEKKKNKEGKEETLGKARRLRAIVGVRDREHQKVEIIRLEDPKDKKPVPIEGAQFVVEGGNGLHDDDAVKIEEEEHKDKEEK